MSLLALSEFASWSLPHADLPLRWFALGLDVSIKAAALALLAAAILALLGIRDVNIRHRVWTGVLAGMLLLPALTHVVPVLRLPIAFQPGWFIAADVDETAPERALAAERRELAANVIAQVDAMPSSAAPNANTGRDALPADRRNRLPVGETGADSLWAGAADGPRRARLSGSTDPLVEERDDAVVDDATRPVATVPVHRQALRVLPALLCCGWLVGAALMTLRLLTGMWLAFRLHRASTPISPAALSERTGEGLGLRREICIQECPHIRVPLTVGCLRPQILLPPQWRDWSCEKLQAVLAHEQTHAERGDCLWALLAEVNRCWYWFHPLSWWLRQQLSSLAEAACDDAAVDSTGDRTRYARHLLEVASEVSGQRGRVVALGVSMARRSHVETRINSILDFTRPLSRRMTWGTTLVLLGIIVPMIALAAALRPGEGKTEGTAEAVAVVETASPTLESNASTSATLDSSPNGLAIAEATTIKKEAVSRTSEAEEAARTFAGTVVDPIGKPLAGAEIWFVAGPADHEAPFPLGTARQVAHSDPQGKFSFQLKPARGAGDETLVWMYYTARVTAKNPGYGLDWLPLAVFEENPPASEKREDFRKDTDKRLGVGRFAGRTLKLPPETGPVRGRLVDLEGHPLANVAVSVEDIQYVDFAELSQAFTMSSRDQADQSLHAHGVPGNSLSRHEWQTLMPAATTNQNGEFSLQGLGRDQMATAVFSGERVAAERLFILGREMEAKKLPHLPFYPTGAQDVFVGTQFTHAVGPTIPVSGVVTEFKSGKPIAGASVFVERLFRVEDRNSPTQLRLRTEHIRAVTDNEGRYRLVGIPPGKGHVLNVVPPKSEPWLIASHEFSVEPSLSSATVNVQVFRGIWIEGQVTDSTTSAPLPGHVDYLALQKNPHIPQKFGLQENWQIERFPIDASGRYRVAGLPGPGVLLVRSFGKTVYPLSVGAEKVDGYEKDYLPTSPIGLPLSNWHLIHQIDPPVDAESYAVDLTLTAGVSLTGRVVRQDGTPASNVEVLGLLEKSPFFRPITYDKFTIVGYEPAAPRNLFFRAADHSLVGYLRLEGTAPAEITVALQPAVTVRGRLIETEKDEEAVGYELSCESTKLGKYRVDDNVFTDKNGRFELKGLLAGNVYKMDASNPQRFSNGKNRFTIDLSDAKPGDVLELEDVTGKKAKEKAAGGAKKPAPTTMTANSATTPLLDPSANGGRVVRGRVIDTKGGSVAGADVAVIAFTNRESQGGVYPPRNETIAEGTTDGEGRYSLSIARLSSKSHRSAKVIVRAKGTGLVWKSLNPDAGNVDESFTLLPEQIMRGRFIDIEGLPLPNLTMSIEAIVISTSNDHAAQEFVGFGDFNQSPQAWPAEIVSDQQGRFAVHGIAPGNGIFLTFVGNDRVARQTIALNTGMPERRGERDLTYRSLVRNFGPGTEGVIPLATAQIVTGVIRYEDTGLPAPNARLTIWASQQTVGGSMYAVAGQADEQGRYHVNPHPGVRFGIKAFPPDGTPYLIRRIDDIVHNVSNGAQTMDVALPRGVLVRGRVVEAGTNAPIARASIQYVPREATQQRAGDDILTGWEGIQISREDGAFEIVVLPGQGTLVTHGPQGQFVVQESSWGQVARGLPGGDRYYAHAFVPVNPEPKSDPLDVTIELERGATVAGRLENEAGEPVARAILLARQQINPGFLAWRAIPQNVFDGRFEISGLADGVKYPVHFLDAKNRLGATAFVTSRDTNPTIQLKPCGEAIARLVNNRGEPVSEPSASIDIALVVTPSSNRLAAAMGVGMGADSEFVVNFDPLNYRPHPKPDAEGRVRFPALIPGARYRVARPNSDMIKEFVAESGKTEDLGKIVVKEDE